MTTSLDGCLKKATDFLRRLAFLPLVAAGFLWLAPALASTERRFDFEDLPVRTVVNAQYGARGVIFFGAYVDNDPHARSGTRVLRSRSLNEEVFTPAPFVMTFTSPHSHVAMHASNRPGVTGNGTLKVFDASGTLLAQDGPKPVPNDSFNAFFEVRFGTASITRAELQLEGTAFEAIDDLVVSNLPLVSCPAAGEIVDIKSSDPDARGRLQAALAKDGTTVRLGPDVDLDFSDLPADFFPLSFGRCVTLTSVSAFTDVILSPPAAATSIPRGGIGPRARSFETRRRAESYGSQDATVARARAQIRQAPRRRANLSRGSMLSGRSRERWRPHLRLPSFRSRLRQPVDRRSRYTHRAMC